MEIIGFLIAAWLIYTFFSDGSSSSRSADRTSYTRKKPDTAFRPQSRNRSATTGIKFKATQGTDSTTIKHGTVDIEGLHDAFTGAPLDRSKGLYQCSKCSVFYHKESVDVLNEANQGKCVSCLTASVVLLGAKPSAKPSSGKEFRPDAVTLGQIHRHFGRVVTFEGKVRKVLTSRRGADYAVMFEDKSWTKGFKLVFFKGTIRKVGGPAFIDSLVGRTVQVRGLLINHERFGPEIIVSERQMIRDIS